MVSPSPELSRKIENSKRVRKEGKDVNIHAKYFSQEYIDSTTLDKLEMIKPWKPEMQEKKIKTIEESSTSSTPYITELTNFTILDKIIVLCVDFSDRVQSTPISTINNRIFGMTNSLYTYYKEISYNRFNFTGEVHGWYRAPQPSTYYTNGNYGRGAYPNNIQKLIYDVINIASTDPSINWNNIDVNNDNTIDFIMIIIAGKDASLTGIANDFWATTWGFNTTTIGSTGKTFGTACASSEYYYTNTNIGTDCHEFGHVLGLADEYDTSLTTYGVGDWSIMGYGSWLNLANTPCHPSPRCKQKLGLINPAIDVTGSINLINSTQNPIAIKYTSDKNIAPYLDEYWLIENRQQIGYDTYLRGNGLLIWKVDSRATGPCYYIQIQEADGQFNMMNKTNYGDSTDPYPISTNNSFTPTSNPRPTYCDGTYYNKLSITNITRSGSNITFTASITPICNIPTANMRVT